MDTFAERLTTLRKRTGLKQDDFASIIGVSVDTVRRWEGGKQEPRLSELRLIAKTLETPIDKLIEGDTKNIPEQSKAKIFKARAPKSTNNKRTIVIQQGNVRLEIPATTQGYAILKEKLKEVSINQDTPYVSIEE